MIPKGREDSRYMHSCLNIPARTYNSYNSDTLIAMAFETYQGLHRKRSTNVLSLANIIKLVWEKAKPATPDEQLALSTVVGVNYGREDKIMMIGGLMSMVQEKVGLDLVKDDGLKYDAFYETAREILGVDSDMSWVTTQAESDMEFISAPENN